MKKNLLKLSFRYIFKYRAMAINGVFHSNYNYMLWYGLNPLRDTLHKIEDIVHRMNVEYRRERELRKNR